MKTRNKLLKVKMTSFLTMAFLQEYSMFFI